jgi:hypothetical protein
MTINKTVFKISLLSILVLVLGTIGLLMYKLGFSEIYINIQYFCNWLYDYVSSFKGGLIPVYGIIIAAFFIFITTLFTFIFTIKRFNFIVLLISGSLLFAVQFVNKYLMTTNTFYLFLFLMVIYYMKHIFIKNSSTYTNEYISPSAFLMFIVPLCAIILFVTYIIPSSPKPLEWKWLDGKLKLFYNSYFTAGIPSKFDYFSLTETGFGSDSKNLGGKISKNKNLVLKVKSPRSLYLKGSVKDVYTGRAWLNSDYSAKQVADKGNDTPIDYNDILRSINDKYFLDSSKFDKNNLLINYLELLSGMSLLTNDQNLIRNYFTRDKIDITFHNLSTKTIFLPENTYQINTPKIDLILGSNSDMTTSKQMSKNFKYSLYSLNLVMSKKAEDLLRKSHKDFFQEYFDDYNYIVNQIGEKSNAVLQAFNENMDTPIELVQVKDLKYLIFAVGKNINAASNSSEVDSFLNSFSKVDINNIPLKVKDAVELNRGEEQTTLSDKNVILTLASDYANSYMIPLNDNSLKIVSSYFTYNLKDISMSINPLNPIVMSLLRINANEAYSKYLQLPEALPPRIKSLAKSITDSKDNRYDKVKAIEKYLSNNYKYTLTPNDTPQGRDFVDYFLFDEKKGYCTYYATSMVVMLRSLGIPARYVEGYIVTSGSKKGNEYHVTNEKAHAWVEAYFEGFGWIKFEPTAAYSSNDGQNNGNANEDEKQKGNKPSWIENQNKPNTANNILVNQLPDNYNKPLIILAVIIIISTLGLLFLAALILINFIKGKKKLKTLTHMDPRESIISVYKLILQHMSILGYNMLDKETPKDYALRMGNFIAATHINLNAVTDVFITARYSKNDITVKDKSYVLDNFYSLSLYTRQNMGKFKHFVLKYFKGKI